MTLMLSSLIFVICVVGVVSWLPQTRLVSPVEKPRIVVYKSERKLVTIKP